nr:MFS transporter [Nocardia farcinica]
MSGPTLVFLGAAATHNALLGSFCLSAFTISAALGGPILGTLLDRSPTPGKLLSIVLTLYAGGFGATCFAISHGATWIAITTAFAAGLPMSAVSGGWSSRLKSIIGPSASIKKASAIDATTFNISGLIGPAVAGTGAILLGPIWVAAFVAILLALAAATALRLPAAEADYTNRRHNVKFASHIAKGFTIIARRQRLLRATIVSAISYFGIGTLWIACPLIGDEAFGNTGFGGLLMAILSVGALAGTAMYAKLRSRHSADSMLFVSTIVLAIAILTLSSTAHPFFIAAAMLSIGFADGPQLAAVFAIRNRDSPVSHRGQVFTTGASVKISSAALGAFVAGLFAGHSVATLLLIAGISQIAASFAYITLTLLSGVGGPPKSEERDEILASAEPMRRN